MTETTHPPEKPVPRTAGKRWRSQVRRRVYANAVLGKTYLIINFFATVVASYGLLANSTAVVIGAMLIATLLGPISGIALALVDANQVLLKRALIAEAAGALLVVVVSYVIGLIHQDVFLSAEILSRTHPNILDLMIALGGGAAGGLATINKRISQGLVGTAIATALVPPLASCGICLAHGETRLGWGAFLLFFANLVAIQFASSVVLWVAGFHDLLLFKEKRSLYLLRNGVSVVLLLAMGGTFAVNFADSVASQNYEARVRSILVRALRAYPGTHLADVAITRSGNRSIILAVVRTPYSLSPDRISGIEALLPGGSRESELHVQSVIVKEATSRGYLHETKQAEAPEEGLKNPLPPAELDDSSPPQGEAQRDADTRTSTP